MSYCVILNNAHEQNFYFIITLFRVLLFYGLLV